MTVIKVKKVRTGRKDGECAKRDNTSKTVFLGRPIVKDVYGETEGQGIGDEEKAVNDVTKNTSKCGGEISNT